MDGYNSSGIYAIVNTLSGKKYIGSSTNIHRRLMHHRWQLTNGVHSNEDLQKDWAKCGETMFSFTPLFECHPGVRHLFEQIFIEITNNTYNLKGVAKDIDELKPMGNPAIELIINPKEDDYICSILESEDLDAVWNGEIKPSEIRKMFQNMPGIPYKRRLKD
jgi:hypothetical protein